MKININESNIQANCTVYYLYEEDNLSRLPEDVKAFVELIIKNEKFKGEFGESFSYTKEKDGEINQVLFMGLGKEENLNRDKLRVISGKTVKKAKELKCESININVIRSIKASFADSLSSMIEGLYLGDYKFTKYKTDKKIAKELEVNISGLTEEEVTGANTVYDEAKMLSEATILARDLVNEPANVLTPKVLAKEAKQLGDKYGFEVEVLDKKEIEALNMDAFLSVAKGSENPPRFIVMRYLGNAEDKENILGLVGKGLTYDAGGYSLKPSDSMITMKNDMGGSAAVIGAMCAITERKLKVNVIAVVAACENMISGGAYKPGDIIGSMAGKTIEIINTDAEGRLTLIDAVHYIIEKEKATKVIDIATLTGHMLVALGTTTTGVITNNDEFFNELKEASNVAGENMWQLPSSEECKETLKSDVADLKNRGARWGGGISAGLFIGEFVQNKPWLHIDIAGTAWSDSEKDYISKGGTGVGVRTLYYMAKNM
jgi:leucyl aminopeptidase